MHLITTCYPLDLPSGFNFNQSATMDDTSEKSEVRHYRQRTFDSTNSTLCNNYKRVNISQLLPPTKNPQKEVEKVKGDEEEKQDATAADVRMSAPK